jgi:hypothetical protein
MFGDQNNIFHAQHKIPSSDATLSCFLLLSADVDFVQ